MSARHEQVAAKLLASIEVDRDPSAEDRAKAVEMMDRALKQAARRRARARWTLGALAAAAALAAAVAFAGAWPGTSSGAIAVHAQPIGDGAVLSSEGAERALEPGAPLERGTRLVARNNGGATLELSTGTRIALEPYADLTVVERTASQRFALAGGALRADVAKLAPDQRFVVLTLDAEIEVRGTSFRVAIAPPDSSCENATRTRVEVFEGSVRVRAKGGETAVGAGESWPSCKQTSHLAEQNGLFARAAAEHHRGDDKAAIALYDELLAKYPDSPLAEIARAERLRLARDD